MGFLPRKSSRIQSDQFIAAGTNRIDPRMPLNMGTYSGLEKEIASNQ